MCFFFFFQAEDGIRDKLVTGVQTCALPICLVRECDREDACGRDAPLLDQVSDPRREDARFPRARAGEHQQRAAGMPDRGLLGGIEGQAHFALTSGNSSTNSAPPPFGPGRYSSRPACCCSTMRRGRASPIPPPPGLVGEPCSDNWCPP